MNNRIDQAKHSYLEGLYEEYEVGSKQMAAMLDDTMRLKIRRSLEAMIDEIRKYEKELGIILEDSPLSSRPLQLPPSGPLDSEQPPTNQTTFEGDTSEPVHTGSGDINYIFTSRRSTNIPSGLQWQEQVAAPFLTPALPPQGIFGRSRLIKKIIAGLHLDNPDAVDVPPLALRGMAGIGKTTLLTAVGRLQLVQEQFPDGVLWTSVGQDPTIRLLLDSWGRALGIDLNVERDERACQERLRAVLHARRMLLLVDDVWEQAHGDYFQLAGPHCRLVFTTRESEVAYHLATRQRSLRVDLLEPEAALALLRQLAPEAVSQDLANAKALCERLEYLPLAITLAGRLLAAEEIPSRTQRLLRQLVEREGALDLVEPAGRAGSSEDKPISVRGILALSVDRLEPVDKERFAMAGVFGGDPLTWELDAAAYVWECSKEQAEDTTSRLMRHGLVEMRGDHFWMHALLADYAEELMEDLGL
ncbi:MAG: hypothetical protein KDE56_03260 [Anaerolineales bacterium]|nr:hypothetical protein [Anaerolineales bacterium]